MRLEDIGFYTLSDERAKTASAATPVTRLECIITDRCNFRCPYCRGIQPSLRGEMGANDLSELLGSLGVVENIRFSGGEPTLNYDLREMAIRAREHGVKRIAISTNGSAPIDIYEDLIDAGVNDFSISLDACCSAGFSEMSGGDDRWGRVTENIRELSRRVYTTVGVVLNEQNEAATIDIIRYASGLGVADIRIIPSSQRGPILADLHYESTRFPILRYRIGNAARGIHVRGISEHDFHKCPLALDDAVAAKGKHFPCIIYMREGGPPIGECRGDVRGDRGRWFEKTNTCEDAICRANCLDVCRDYNNKWRDYSIARCPLPRLPNDSFSWGRWRNGSEGVKGIVGEWRFANLTSPSIASQIRGLATGWAFSRDLSCRPKNEEVALMYATPGLDDGWTHLRANEMWEIFSHEAARP
jgi:MoaA/NifB/PqqE/SkfB family radical SAM enzyme